MRSRTELIQNAKQLATNPEIRRRYIQWKASTLLTGTAPSVTLPKGRRLYPADRFNDFVAIIAQHPSESEWRVLNDLLAECGGGVFVDVGANIGAMTVLAHSTGRVSSILSFEPSPRYCDAWHRNVLANHVDNATLFEAAVGDYDGTVQFRMDPRMPLNGKIDRGKVHFSTNTEKVRILRLDTICASLNVDSIALLKLDVEGAEPLIIRGAQGILSSGRVRSILLEFIVEFMEDMGEDPYEFVNLLTRLGFTLYSINADGALTKIAVNGPQEIVDSRRVRENAPLRPFEAINLVAKWSA